MGGGCSWPIYYTGVGGKEAHGNQGATPAQDPRQAWDLSGFVSSSVTRAKCLHSSSLLLWWLLILLALYILCSWVLSFLLSLSFLSPFSSLALYIYNWFSLCLPIQSYLKWFPGQSRASQTRPFHRYVSIPWIGCLWWLPCFGPVQGPPHVSAPA